MCPLVIEMGTQHEGEDAARGKGTTCLEMGVSEPQPRILLLPLSGEGNDCRTRAGCTGIIHDVALMRQVPAICASKRLGAVGF